MQSATIKAVKFFLLFFIVLPILFLSCAKTNEEKALEIYKQAQENVEKGTWSSARILLDSIHQQYPREVKVRRMADSLSWNIELNENKRTLAYIDSMLPQKQEEFDRLKKDFTFSKEENYQDYGVFLHKTMSIGYNLQRTYLKPSVDEKGEMMILSQYYGTADVQHHAVCLEADGVSYTTKDNGDYNSFKDDNLHAETLLFDHNEALAIGNFVKTHRSGRVKVILNGLQHYTYYLTETDKKAIEETLIFTGVVYDCYRIKEERKHLQQRNAQLQARLKL